jgi:hypothetical protein
MGHDGKYTNGDTHNASYELALIKCSNSELAVANSTSRVFEPVGFQEVCTLP